MRVASKIAHHGRSLLSVTRLAEHARTKHDDGVGGEHRLLRVLRRHRTRLQQCEPAHVLAWRFAWAGSFGDRRMHDAHRKAEPGEQLPATRRGRGQNEGHAPGAHLAATGRTTSTEREVSVISTLVPAGIALASALRAALVLLSSWSAS